MTTTTISIRGVKKEVKEKLMEQAKKENRSFANYIRLILEKSVK